MSKVCFEPRNEKDLRRQYSELNTISEFQPLATKELLFVWWYSNPTSKFNNPESDEKMDDGPEKVSAALRKSYGKSLENHGDKEMKYRTMQFPDITRFAMERMRNLRPDLRIRGTVMVDTIMENYEKLVKIDVDTAFKIKTFDSKGSPTGEYEDFGMRKQYIDSMKTISNNLPDLIKQAEEGFGIKEKEKDKQHTSGDKAVHRFHNNKKENS